MMSATMVEIFTNKIIVGWSVAKFGLFGNEAQQIQSPMINYLGGGVMFVFVYCQQNREHERGEEDSDDTLGRTIRSGIVPMGVISNGAAVTMGSSTEMPENDENKATSGESRGTKKWHLYSLIKSRKMIFVSLAVCLGCLHGLTPIVYVQDNDQNASENVLDFVFSHFCAVFFFSTFYFVLYSLFRRGRPFVHSSLVLPSVAYGLLWSVGMTLFIVSNRILSQPISFPVTVRLPAIIGVLVDVFLFKDIRGNWPF